jgi:D-alanyl-D-alanine carboxypeptidase
MRNYTQAIKEAEQLLDLWLPWKIKYEQRPSLSVGIVYDGKLVYKRSFGYASLEKKIKATPTTNYRIASISKFFTAIAIMQLVERGEIRLDDKVAKYLPWFDIKNKALNSNKISIKHLLSHTAGLCRDGYSAQWENDKFPDKKKLIKSIEPKFLVFNNSEHFKYANFGFALLGRVIEEVSGLEYNDYVEKNIIRRIRMGNTYPDFTEKAEHGLATGYSRFIPDQKKIGFKNISTNAYSPATGFLSNIEDLSKLAISFFKDERLIKKKSKIEMMQKRKQTSPGKKYYGFGLDVFEINKQIIVGHSGGFSGFSSRMSFDCKSNLAVITLTNTGGYVSPINEGIFELVYEIDRRLQQKNSNQKVNSKRYEGIYESRWSTNVVKEICNKLIIFDMYANKVFANESLAFFKPLNNHKFLIEQKDNFDSNGEIAEFIFKKKGQQVDYLNYAGHINKKVG